MSLYRLKPKFQSALLPLATALHRHGVSANQVTIAACVLSLLVGALLSCFAPNNPKLMLVLPVWLLVRMALNAIDGMLARQFSQPTKLGGFLNEITDVLSDTALYLPFIWFAPFNVYSVFAFIFLAQLTEFAGVLGLAIMGVRRYDGPMGKSDRAFVIGALATFLACSPLSESLSSSASSYAYSPTVNFCLSVLFPLMSALCLLTVWQRIRYALANNHKP